jgi:hypothetical protein
VYKNDHFTKTGSGQTSGKPGLFEPFMYKNDHFTKTGSGQTSGKLQKESRFLAGATVDTLTFGADNKGYMASAAAEFYRLRWQLVKAAQSISAYPSLETEGHDLPVCDESEFSTTLAVPGKPSLVKLDIPWAQGKKTHIFCDAILY